MTSENYDLFSDGTIDETWTNELEIINNYDANGDLLDVPDTLQVWNNVANIQDAEGIGYQLLFRMILSMLN